MGTLHIFSLRASLYFAAMKCLTVSVLLGLQLASCSAQWSSRRRHQPSSPPNKTVTTYHLFQRKYTGLANKDAGDFLGDASFIFLTFNPFEANNPEASIEENVLEMSTV